MSYLRLVIIALLQISGWIINTAAIVGVIYCIYSFMLLQGFTEATVEPQTIITTIFGLGIVLAIAELVITSTIKPNTLLEWGFACPVIDVTKEPGYPETFGRIAQNSGSIAPKVILFESNFPFGFAVGRGNQNQGEVYLSRGLFQKLDTAEKMKWFMANQLHHLKGSFGTSTKLWLNLHIVRTRLDWVFKNRINQFFNAMASVILFKWLASFIMHIFFYFKWLFTIGNSITTYCFHVVDGFIGAREYVKADDAASKFIGVDAGIELFLGLGKTPEPSWKKIFGNYPTDEYRLKRLQKQQ